MKFDDSNNIWSQWWIYLGPISCSFRQTFYQIKDRSIGFPLGNPGSATGSEELK